MIHKNSFFYNQISTILNRSKTESWNAVVLDNGATNTVAGKEWYNCYQQNQVIILFQYHPIKLSLIISQQEQAQT